MASAWFMTFTGTLIAASLLAGARSSAFGEEVLSAEGETPDMRIEVRDLKRSGDGTVTLRLTLVNDSTERFDHDCGMRDPDFSDACEAFSGGYLLDGANKKKYLVVRDSEKNCICSNVANVEPGKKMNIWATYPAPPAEVAKVTVVVPLFEPIEGVPITGP
ncbi:MAG TPA: hypothetical protein VFK86_20765 [Bauldia sp.]|nr:hypothetical protein [Bauldia sp.]